MIPLTFALGLDAVAALVLLTAIYYGAMYGGRISSILLNIPGDEPAMMTCLDGHPMAKNGRPGDALVISGVASFVGATLSTIGLMFLAPMLSRIAYPAEAVIVGADCKVYMTPKAKKQIRWNVDLVDGRLPNCQP